MANSGMPKDMKDFMPVLGDQGVKNLVGTPKRGVSIQSFQVAMPADGIITFAAVGAEDMADVTYQISIHNHSGTNHGSVLSADKTVTQFKVTGPPAGELLDVIIVGAVKGQLK